MKPLLKTLLAQAPFQALLKSLNDAPSVSLSGCPDDFLSLLVAHLSPLIGRPVIVVEDSLTHAQQRYDQWAQNSQIRLYPHDDFLTLDMMTGKDSFLIERITTLQGLIRGEVHTVLTHPAGLLKWGLHKRHVAASMTTLRVGDIKPIEAFLAQLVDLGYEPVHAVEKPGEFAHRGSIVDIYQVQYDHPVRCDFFDDELDALRVFDVQTQRSIKALKTLTLLPNQALALPLSTRQTMVEAIRKTVYQKNSDQAVTARMEEGISRFLEGQADETFVRHLSLIGEVSSLPDYLEQPLIVWINTPRIDAGVDRFNKEIKQWRQHQGAFGKLPFSFYDDTWLKNPKPGLRLNPFDDQEAGVNHRWRMKETLPYEHNVFALINDLKKLRDKQTVVLLLENEARRKKVSEWLEEHALSYMYVGEEQSLIPNTINLLISDAFVAFEWLDARLHVLSENELFKRRKKKKGRYQSVFKDARKIDHAKALERGDYIVHQDHGIGRFMGLETMQLKDTQNDYMVIAYQGDDKLYIPVENVHLIQKYTALEGMVPKIHRLGGNDWAKTKARARKQAKDVAEKLLKHYAARAQATGFAFSEDTSLMHEFEADFPYLETPDQNVAIAEVKADMELAKPMDRLICGDVGYGKTEIALRAAFKAVLDNKQVAYLAPTTLLTRQHYYTFRDRLAKHGIKVMLVNRFVEPKKQKLALEGLRTGAVDVIIGTHRLLSNDVVFKDLGLLVVDEEQRFGVEHKEKIQAMRAHVDVITLTATPIPRTLQMALSGVKSMSLLNTPPANRHPIQTYVLKRDDDIIKDAIEREISRGGQVFYLYNRVEDIDAIEDHLLALVPSARIITAHGKMDRRSLENTIKAFLDQRYDVLISTTIIETGIDIPNANTLIIHDADQLGLAQLYQIRGRVGRSDRIAYSYMMYDGRKILTPEATKRLQSIRDFTELGSGYKIASRDLAIRGAGDILGTEQSGFIQTVGMEVFLEMVKEELEFLHDTTPKKEAPSLQSLAKLKVSKHIPESYVRDADEKIRLHKEISQLTSSEGARQLFLELEDRYGRPPQTLKTYVWNKVYEHLAAQYGVEHLRQTETLTTATFSVEGSSRLAGDKLFDAAHQLHPEIKLTYKQQKIRLTLPHHKLPITLHEALVTLLESLE